MLFACIQSAIGEIYIYKIWITLVSCQVASSLTSPVLRLHSLAIQSLEAVNRYLQERRFAQQKASIDGLKCWGWKSEKMCYCESAVNAASHTHLWSGHVNSCDIWESRILGFWSLEEVNNNLDKCEIRSSPQLCRVVGWGGDQEWGVWAELAVLAGPT